jgi:hypothetical protein
MEPFGCWMTFGCPVQPVPHQTFVTPRLLDVPQ